MANEKEEKKITIPGYTKAQLVQSSRFSSRRDALNAVLEDGKAYTIAEAQKKLDEFMKQEVK